MKKLLSFLLFTVFVTLLSGQSAVTGTILLPDNEPVVFANVILYAMPDRAMVKVEATDLDGNFSFSNVKAGTYVITASYVGYQDLNIDLAMANKDLNLGQKFMQEQTVQLEGATITAQRALVEVKSDRTVFNVQGTVNSTGENAISLMRKAPGVMVDNNNSISVLGRAGVLVYIDGKRLPLSGTELSNYLQNIPAEQIDKIDIISNPSAKYEAEGNAGIIDIILKKDKNLGYSGTVSATGSMGWHARGNTSLSGNYRNKTMNIFGTVGGNTGGFANNMMFVNEQNGLLLDEDNNMLSMNDNYNVRLGTDFFLSDKHTIGFLVNHNAGTSDGTSTNTSDISRIGSSTIDSILIANNNSVGSNSQNTYNVNYVFNDKGTRFNVDLDFGRFTNDAYFTQPNRYYQANTNTLLTEVLTEYDTPTDIDIYTAKADYERPVGKGSFGFGAKFTKVATANTFLFYNSNTGTPILNDARSNQFDYDENVLAGYVSYSGAFSEKISYTAGIRAEKTDATGDLMAFDPSKAEDPVILDYMNWFPSAGLTYMYAPQHMFALNYGRRINRPDYNVLNPFRIQLSELSFSKGNARLNPEIVNNVELGYTYNYMYNFKLGYSKTLNQITRLIGPDDVDPRAGFISWDNLATQTIYSANVSAPFNVNKWWSLFVNANANLTNNQADYGENGVVDIQAFNYTIFQQSTFNLPKKWQAELSGWFSGPGVWGGVFLYDPSWSLDLGIQKKFFNDALNVRANVSDIFFQSYWSGVSQFNGLKGTGQGNWDSRRVTLSLSYNFGNNNVKSRKRNTGIESETKRIGSGQGN